MIKKPPIIHNHIQLPLTNLYYATCGDGPPLIIVPATISRICDWQPMIQFMGQNFTTHFFELPGHGGSTPFIQPFSSRLVAQTVEDLITTLGYEQITLMGFSFGGILTLRILNQIPSQIRRLVLLSPCVSCHTLQYSRIRVALLAQFASLMVHPAPQAIFLESMHNKKLVDSVLYMLSHWGHVEFYGPALQEYAAFIARFHA